jgi:hypothetical protein
MPITMAAVAVIFLVAGWSLFALKTSFGVNVIGMEAKRLKELHSTTSNVVELAVAILATVAAPRSAL